MGAQDFHAFIVRYSAEPEIRADLRDYIAMLPRDADLTSALAEFASYLGFSIGTQDLLSLDTMLEPLRSASPAVITETLQSFALDYVDACRNPRKFSEAGYFDPEHLKLWRAF